MLECLVDGEILAVGIDDGTAVTDIRKGDALQERRTNRASIGLERAAIEVKRGHCQIATFDDLSDGEGATIQIDRATCRRHILHPEIQDAEVGGG